MKGNQSNILKKCLRVFHLENELVVGQASVEAIFSSIKDQNLLNYLLALPELHILQYLLTGMKKE